MAALRQLPRDGTADAEVEHAIPSAGFVIGRGEGVGLYLDGGSVSRIHARIKPHAGGFVVESLAAHNPVHVGGHPVREHVLVHGDVVTIGAFRLEYRAQNSRSAPTILPTGPRAPAPAPAPIAVQAPLPAPAPTPHLPPPVRAEHARPPSALGGGGLGIVTVLAVVVVGAVGGGGGYWWWTEGRHQYARNEEPPHPDPAYDDTPPGERPQGTKLLVTAEGGKVEVDGVTVEVDPGTFDPGTELFIARRPDLKPFDGSPQLVDPFEVETRGVQPRGDVLVRVDYDGKGFDPDNPPFFASRDGDKWRVYASYYDAENKQIVGRVDHFTPIHILVAVGVAGTTLAVYLGTEYGPDFKQPIFWTYDGVYTTPLGINVYYEPKMFGKARLAGHKHPQYVLDTGAAFDLAAKDLQSRSKFSQVNMNAGDIPPVVIMDEFRKKPADRDLPWSGSGTERAIVGFAEEMASTYKNNSAIRIQLELGPRLLRQTALHESFHVWQTEQVGWRKSEKIGWWREATAEWAGWVGHSAFVLSYNAIEFKRAAHLQQGFHGSDIAVSDKYNLGDFAIHVDELCPGSVVDSYEKTGFVGAGQHWYRGLQALLKSKCGLELEEVLGDYLLAQFLPKGSPRGPGLDDAGLKRFPSNHYIRLTPKRPAVSVAAVPMVIGSADGNYTLVVRPAKSATGRVGLDLWQRPAAPARPLGDAGTDAQSWKSRGYTFKDFGGPQHSPPGRANVAELIFANPTEKPIADEVEVYLLKPPDGLRGSVSRGSKKPKVELAWTPPPLATGKKPADNGALKSFRLYERVGYRTRKLVDIDAKDSKYAGELDLQWEKDKATVFIRSVDKYGNESEKTTEVTLKRPKPKPRVKPKPKPRARPKPSNPCAGCRYNGPECDNINGRCSRQGCCE